VLGFGVLFFTRRAVGAPHYPTKLLQAVQFAIFFVWVLLKSNARVAFDVVTPQHLMRPAIIALPLEAKTDLEITLLANFITLTPGTAAVDVSPDRRLLYVHVMYLDEDADALRRELKDGFERRLLELVR
jgi:multicomponent Na+:H+ antiporter subunit E